MGVTDPIRNYIDTHIPENHRQGDGCWDAAERAMAGHDPYACGIEHERQSNAGTHAFDTACLFCMRPSFDTESGIWSWKGASA